MSAIRVNIINESTNPLPAYATTGSSGLDIRAYLQTTVYLQPLERQLIPTGLFLAIPEGYEVQIRPRSGLALKNGITCLNTPGTIDSDYRGEVKVLLINLSNETQPISHGDRIAQMVIAKVEKAEIVAVDEHDITERGSGGFGHTGLQ